MVDADLSHSAASSEPEPRRRWLILIVVGLIGGLLSGLLGVGGGILMVPLLVIWAGLDQRRASAITLAAIVPTAIAGSANYLLLGHVDLLAGAIIAVGAVVGAIIGAALLKRIPLSWLRWMFIALMVIVAVRMLIGVPAGTNDVELTPWVIVSMLVVGLVMGIASGLFGIGGGLIAVPALTLLFGASALVAKGTSLLIMIPTGIAGTISNHTSRLIDLPSALAVGAAATAASFGGVALAVWLPTELSGVLFALLLLFAATQMTIRALRKT